MKKKLLFAAPVAVIATVLLLAQQADILIQITKGERAVIAVPDFRGSGAAAAVMGEFNQTLFEDLQNSGVFRMAPKSLYPLQIPQRPQDFRPPSPTGQSQGPWLTDWSGPPVNANFLAFGYTGVQNDRLVLFAWLYNVNQPDLTNAQVIGKLYFGSLDVEGARKVAHEFAADILKLFGAESLAGTKIYFVSNRTGSKEIWSMDFDGSNQKQITFFRSITIHPAVSPDGKLLAFTTFAKGNPSIVVQSLETGRQLRFYNQRASMNANPFFTPDGQSLLLSSTASGVAQIYRAGIDGSGWQRISTSSAIEVEPKVNPKTGAEIVFVSGRSGPPQIYRMSMEGLNVERLTPGEGEAVNPSWHPDGRHIAFAWTRGYEPGNFNIFVMDVASRQFLQLTSGAGRNENPVWAPDGRHLAFSSNRSGRNQIWTMLANGTGLKQLTTQGENTTPFWAR